MPCSHSHRTGTTRVCAIRSTPTTAFSSAMGVECCAPPSARAADFVPRSRWEWPKSVANDAGRQVAPLPAGNEGAVSKKSPQAIFSNLLERDVEPGEHVEARARLEKAAIAVVDDYGADVSAIEGV